MKKRNWLNVAAIVLSTIMFLQSMPDKLLFALAEGVSNLVGTEENVVNKILTEISDGIIQNTLGVFSENILAYLTIQTSVSMVACWYTNTEIKQFYVVQYRGV